MYIHIYTYTYMLWRYFEPSHVLRERAPRRRSTAIVTRHAVCRMRAASACIGDGMVCTCGQRPQICTRSIMVGRSYV